MKSCGRDPTERTKALQANSANSSGGRVGATLLGGGVGQCSAFVVIVGLLLGGLVALTGADVFTVGYLTGSQRRPGDRVYARPGKFNLVHKKAFSCSVIRHINPEKGLLKNEIYIALV